MKIGQEIELKTGFRIKTVLSGKVLQVKQGDKAIATRTGLKILNGEGRGKITNYQEGEHIRGYDHKNISKMIYRRLNNAFLIEQILEDEGYSSRDAIEEIEDILTDIL